MGLRPMLEGQQADGCAVGKGQRGDPSCCLGSGVHSTGGDLKTPGWTSPRGQLGTPPGNTRQAR